MYYKECVMATHMPNPINFNYTSNESLLNKLTCSIKYVLMYTRTHLTRSNEPRLLRCVLRPCNTCSQQPFCVM